MSTIDISMQLQCSREMSMGSTFRQVSSPTITLRHGRINSSPRYTGPQKTSEVLLQIYQQDQDSRNPNTMLWSQSSILVRDPLDYTKGENQLYNIAWRERCKLDEDSEVNISASEHISDRCHRTALLVRKSRYNRNRSHSDSSNFSPSISSSVKMSVGGQLDAYCVRVLFSIQ